MISLRPRDRLASLLALALGLWAGGSQARADLMLTITDASTNVKTGVVTTLESMVIDSTKGKATFTSNTAGTFVFNIDGTNVTFVVTTAGAAVVGKFADYADDGTVSFEALGSAGKHPISAFGGFNIANVSANTGLDPTVPALYDGATVAGNKAIDPKIPETLTITPSYSFDILTSPKVTLQSDLASAPVGSGTATFVSTIGKISTSSLTATGYSSSSNSISAKLKESPYTVSNQLVLSGLAKGQTDNISSDTIVNSIGSPITPSVLPTPEPSTIVAALIALPAVLIQALRRRATA